MFSEKEEDIIREFAIRMTNNLDIMKELKSILENNTDSLRVFLENSNQNKAFIDIKNILFEENGHLFQDKFENFKAYLDKNVFTLRNKHAIFLMADHESSSTSDSSFRSGDIDSQESSNPTWCGSQVDVEFRNISGTVIKQISEVVIKGDCSTYARAMMGGLDYDRREEKNGQSVIYISENTSLKRPTGVRGSLGRIAGNHVIPISDYIKNLELEIKGKPVIQAIRDLCGMLGASNLVDQNQNFPQKILDDARGFYEIGNPTFEIQFDAFRFLSREMIPTMTALHNQSIAAAFAGDRETSVLLDEARNVNQFLDRTKANLDQEIKDFISVVDYVPVDNQPLQISEENIKHGIRDNHLDSLCYVMGDVVGYFLHYRAIEAEDCLLVTEKLVEETLERKGWRQHYENHSSDLNSATNLENINQHIIDNIKKRLSIYYADTIILRENMSVDSSSVSSTSEDHMQFHIATDSSTNKDNPHKRKKKESSKETKKNKTDNLHKGTIFQGILKGTEIPNALKSAESSPARATTSTSNPPYPTRKNNKITGPGSKFERKFSH